MARSRQFVIEIGRYVGNLAERRQAVHHAAHLGDDFAERVIRIVLGADVEDLGFKNGPSFRRASAYRPGPASGGTYCHSR